MRSSLDTTTRWCPVCGRRGVPIVWGEPSEHIMRLADEGRVIIAGCTPVGIHASHACGSCEVEFIASDRLYRREVVGSQILGIGVWPHGRRPVRVEKNDEGWTVVVAKEGSMLISRDAIPVLLRDVFDYMWPWQVEEWTSRRGFDAVVSQDEDGGWQIRVEPAQLFELTLVKHWWRGLGRSPVKTAIERLTSESHSPIWLPNPD